MHYLLELSYNLMSYVQGTCVFRRLNAPNCLHNFGKKGKMSIFVMCLVYGLRLELPGHNVNTKAKKLFSRTGK